MKSPKWTPEEEDLLRKLYPKGGINKCCEALPDRTHYAIRNRVDLMRLRREYERQRTVGEGVESVESFL